MGKKSTEKRLRLRLNELGLDFEKLASDYRELQRVSKTQSDEHGRALKQSVEDQQTIADLKIRLEQSETRCKANQRTIETLEIEAQDAKTASEGRYEGAKAIVDLLLDRLENK